MNSFEKGRIIHEGSGNNRFGEGSTLYHVSFDRVQHFIPRVPERTAAGEDTQTPRICLSDSIVRCINTRPGQAWPIYHAMRVGIPVGFYVYAFPFAAIPGSALLVPEDVAKHGVRDAVYWHEYWLLSAPTDVTETFVVVKSITYQHGCAPAKWARAIVVEPSEDPDIHFLEEFARKTSEKLNEKITTDILYRDFADELRQLWDIQHMKRDGNV